MDPVPKPPQLITGARMLYLVWIPAEPDAVSALVPDGLTPAARSPCYVNQYVVERADAISTPEFGSYSLTYLGVDLAGLDTEAGTPARWWTHYLNSSEAMIRYAAEHGVPAGAGRTTLELADGRLVATTFVDGVPTIGGGRGRNAAARDRPAALRHQCPRRARNLSAPPWLSGRRRLKPQARSARARRRQGTFRGRARSRPRSACARPRDPGRGRAAATRDAGRLRRRNTGMSVQRVESTLGVDLDVQTLGPGGSCGTALLRLPGLRGHALFLKGRLGSLWFERGVRTDRGVRIGSSLAALRAAYPKLRSRPNKYVPNARDYFTRRPDVPHWRLRFDVSPRGKVTSIAFGNTSVFLVEGCA